MSTRVTYYDWDHDQGRTVTVSQYLRDHPGLMAALAVLHATTSMCVVRYHGPDSHVGDEPDLVGPENPQLNGHRLSSFVAEARCLSEFTPTARAMTPDRGDDTDEEVETPGPEPPKLKWAVYARTEDAVAPVGRVVVTAATAKEAEDIVNYGRLSSAQYDQLQDSAEHDAQMQWDNFSWGGWDVYDVEPIGPGHTD